MVLGNQVDESFMRGIMGKVTRIASDGNDDLSILGQIVSVSPHVFLVGDR